MPNANPDPAATPDAASLAAFAGWNPGALLPAAATANASVGTSTSTGAIASATVEPTVALAAVTTAAGKAGLAEGTTAAPNVEAWLEALLHNAAETAGQGATGAGLPAVSSGDGCSALESTTSTVGNTAGGAVAALAVFGLAAPQLAGGTAVSASSPAEVPPPVQLHSVDAPQQWGTQIEWTLKSGLQEARVEVSPGALGPVQIHLQMVDSTLSLHLHAAQPETRALLQEQLPALRQVLAQSGINVGDAQVGQGQQRFDPPQRVPATRRGGDTDAAVNKAATLSPVRVLRRGLLDDYA